MNGKHFRMVVYSLCCQPKFNFSPIGFLQWFQFSPEWISSQWSFYLRFAHRTTHTQKPTISISNEMWKELKFNLTANSIINHKTLAVVNDNSAIFNCDWIRNGICFSHLLSSINRINLNAHIEFHIEVFLPRSFQKTWPEFKLFIYSNVLAWLYSMLCSMFIQWKKNRDEDKKKDFLVPSNGFRFDGLEWIVADLFCGSQA